jgi:hypothetical protein
VQPPRPDLRTLRTYVVLHLPQSARMPLREMAKRRRRIRKRVRDSVRRRAKPLWKGIHKAGKRLGRVVGRITTSFWSIALITTFASS